MLEARTGRNFVAGKAYNKELPCDELWVLSVVMFETLSWTVELHTYVYYSFLVDNSDLVKNKFHWKEIGGGQAIYVFCFVKRRNWLVFKNEFGKKHRCAYNVWSRKCIKQTDGCKSITKSHLNNFKCSFIKMYISRLWYCYIERIHTPCLLVLLFGIFLI